MSRTLKERFKEQMAPKKGPLAPLGPVDSWTHGSMGTERALRVALAPEEGTGSVDTWVHGPREGPEGGSGPLRRASIAMGPESIGSRPPSQPTIKKERRPLVRAGLCLPSCGNRLLVLGRGPQEPYLELSNAMLACYFARKRFCAGSGLGFYLSLG